MDGLSSFPRCGEQAEGPHGPEFECEAEFFLGGGVRGEALADLSQGPGDMGLEHGLEELFLVAEEQVEGRSGHARGRGDVAHGGPPESEAEEDGLSGFQDPGLLLVSHEKRIDKICPNVKYGSLTLFVMMSDEAWGVK